MFLYVGFWLCGCFWWFENVYFKFYFLYGKLYFNLLYLIFYYDIWMVGRVLMLNKKKKGELIFRYD